MGGTETGPEDQMGQRILSATILKLSKTAKFKRKPNVLLEKKTRGGSEEVEDIILSNFKTYCKAIVIKAVWYHMLAS